MGTFKAATQFQKFIYYRTYSRWIEDQNMREVYQESVNRYVDFFARKIDWHGDMFDKFSWAASHIGKMEVMPSMRALWAAGPALEREGLAGYNCSGLVVDGPRAFAETLYLLLNSAGVGFSIERQFVNQMPEIPNNVINTDVEIIFMDSKKGWAEGYLDFINGLYAGLIYKCNLSLIRPKGARLKTTGGRASGPDPLKNLIDFTEKVFMGARGRKLSSIECHDIMCYIASIVVVGGVRRAACISLSNPSDRRMAHAKDGEFWLSNPQRSLSNNSCAYTEKPDPDVFMEEWLTLMRSQTGERGIFNREGVKKSMKKITPWRDRDHDFVVNPCGEAILRPKGLCNLTEAVVRPGDSLNTLKRKVEAATILGVFQSTVTNFDFLSPEWQKNAEDERLLGVSMTGMRDHETIGHVCPLAEHWLIALRQCAREVATEWARKLDINVPAAITLVKPSGTVGLLVDAAPGIHTRFAKYYIRRVRVSRTDPLCHLMIDQGQSWCPETGQTLENWDTAVFDFPMKSSEGAVTNADVTAIESLEYWAMVKEYWCEQNPSCTIFVKESEWLEVGAWVYKNWDNVVGLTFLPKDDMIYPLAPYEEITEEDYRVLNLAAPDLDFNVLDVYENQDMTQGAQELACGGSGCELV